MQTVHTVKKGLDLPLAGIPKQNIDDAFFASAKINEVALKAADYRGMKPSFLVEEGDKVTLGQKLFEDRKTPGVFYTSPGTGTVKAIYRGEKRAFLSIVISLDEKDERVSYPERVSNISDLAREKVKEILLDTGLWTSIRVRPFAKVADPNTEPSSIFVNAMDTNPLAPNPEVIIQKNPSEFQAGLAVLAKLTEGKVHLCKKPNAEIPHGESGRVINHLFDGCHPVGLSGYHIHILDPVTSLSKKVWYVGYQEVIAIGSLFKTGYYPTTRYVAIAGPQVKNPRIVKTRRGINLFDLTSEELLEGENRLISGSVLSGIKADETMGYLGHYDNIVSVLAEDRKRVFHGFLAPGFDKISVKNTFVSRLFPNKKLALGTNLGGSVRDVVPIGSYEEVMPYDMEATFLVRAILSHDTELAEKLGVLELDEEDVGLCTFACPGKNDIGKHLAEVLLEIEKENT